MIVNLLKRLVDRICRPHEDRSSGCCLALQLPSLKASQKNLFRLIRRRAISSLDDSDVVVEDLEALLTCMIYRRRISYRSKAFGWNSLAYLSWGVVAGPRAKPGVIGGDVQDATVVRRGRGVSRTWNFGPRAPGPSTCR